MSYCSHIPLCFDTIKTAKHDYRQPSESEIRDAFLVSVPPRKKAKACTKSTNSKRTLDATGNNSQLPSSMTFPAPLVLPGDELAYDPECPQQSVQDWIEEQDRNEVTDQRRTIYVVPPPSASDDVKFIDDWPIPKTSLQNSTTEGKKLSLDPGSAQQPHIDDVLEYLQAFYHGMPVKLLQETEPEFIAWDENVPPKKSKKIGPGSDIQYVGLSTGNEAIRIRSRPSKDGVFAGQLNLNDLLDAAMSILPDDAYALLMLVQHDLYEDDEDDFCCGRAYGASRIAVVSTARYRPELDSKHKVDVEHSWPASHCSRYVGRFFARKTPMAQIDQVNCKDATAYYPHSGLAAAVKASNSLPLPSAPSELSSLWLGRVCKTASHELGHCFSLDHCSFFGCVMQGTAHLAEDARQPPYLCPIDLSKVIRATGSDEEERYKALLKFCKKREEDRMFAAFSGWLEVRLSTMHDHKRRPESKV